MTNTPTPDRPAGTQPPTPAAGKFTPPAQNRPSAAGPAGSPQPAPGPAAGTFTPPTNNSGSFTPPRTNPAGAPAPTGGTGARPTSVDTAPADRPDAAGGGDPTAPAPQGPTSPADPGAALWGRAQQASQMRNAARANAASKSGGAGGAAIPAAGGAAAAGAGAAKSAGATAGVGGAAKAASSAGAAKAAGAAGAAKAAGGAAGAAAPMPQIPQDTTLKGPVGSKVEQATRMGANAGAQMAAAGTGVGAVGAAAAGKAADKIVAQGFKKAVAAVGAAKMLLIAALVGAFVLTMTLDGNPLTARFPLPDAPRKEQVEAIPPGWASIAYAAQDDTKTGKFGVPWTVLAGLMKVQSDYGRTAPYDTIDRDPTRDPKFGPPPGMQGSSGAVVSATGYTGPVLVVGTDLTTPMTAVLPSRLSGNPVTFDTVKGRRTAAAVTALTQRAKDNLPGIVVMDVGGREDLTTAEYTKLIDRAVKVAGDSTTLLWFTAHNGADKAAAATFNQALAAAASRHDTLRVLPWAKTAADNAAFVAADKVTPTEQGTQARARLIGDAVSGAGSSTGFQNPLKAGTYKLSSPFGMRIHPITHQPKLHGGLDFAASGGTPIYASAPGTVAQAGFDTGGFGNLTVIKHDGGIETYYAHQSAFKVKTGDRVTAGQLIGNVGTTGASTGDHLHFEVRVNGTRQDPAKYLPGGANHATTDTPRSEVASFGSAATSSLAAAQCAVEPASPAIGGKKNQASGPFLLRPEHAAKMRDRHKDPNDPCQAAHYVAEQLVKVGEEVIEDHKEWVDSDDKARALWTEVIARANLFSDPNNGNTDCTVPTTGSLDVSYAVESIFTCEALRAKSINVAVAAAVTDGGKVTFETVTGSDAISQLVTEALNVSYAFSKHRTDNCDNGNRLTGIFPLSASVAAKYGAADRCDAQGNIRAAAKAILAGEAVPVGSRSVEAGPYAPMIGGWSVMPWALGSDAAVMATRGPRVQWQSPRDCDTAIKAWLSELVDAGVPTKGDLVTFVKATKGSPASSPMCKSPSNAAFAEQASLLAESVANKLTAAADTTPAPAPTETAPAVEPTTPSVLDQPDLREAAVLEGAAAYARLATHFNTIASQEDLGTAKGGSDSLIPRLSTTGKSVTFAPRSNAAASTFTFPTAPASLDYAVNYGGIRPDWSTFGDQVGIVGQVVGAGGGAVGAGGEASVVIEAAKKWLGTPYSWGGGNATGPTKGQDRGANTVGFDCSGLTEYAFAQAGYKIGGNTFEQAPKGTAVKSLAEALPGDLIFWGADLHHVAIYLGDNKIIHAPRTGDVVKIAPVYNTGNISAIRRIVAPGPAGGGPAGPWADALPANGKQYAGLFQAAGQKYGVEPQLMAGLAWQESGYRPEIVECRLRSGVGAMGIMQFMPGTAAGFGIDPCKPEQAVDAGTKYIAQLYRMFGTTPLALAGYNAGPGNVKKYGGVPPFGETQHYVQVVADNCRKLGGRCT